MKAKIFKKNLITAAKMRIDRKDLLRTAGFLQTGRQHNRGFTFKRADFNNGTFFFEKISKIKKNQNLLLGQMPFNPGKHLKLRNR